MDYANIEPLDQKSYQKRRKQKEGSRPGHQASGDFRQQEREGRRTMQTLGNRPRQTNNEYNAPNSQGPRASSETADQGQIRQEMERVEWEQAAQILHLEQISKQMANGVGGIPHTASNPSSFGHTQVLQKQLNDQKVHVENLKPARNQELQVAKDAINFFPTQKRNNTKTAQTSNMYYYTSDTSENEANGADAKADESSRIIRSKQQEKVEGQHKYVLFQNQVRMAHEQPLPLKTNFGLTNAANNPQQQSKPHLPKNAHIAVNYLQPQLAADGGQAQENHLPAASRQNTDEQFWSQELNGPSANQPKFKETQQVFIPNIFQKNEMDNRNIGGQKGEKTLKLSKDQVIRGEQKRRNSLSSKSPKKQQQPAKQALYKSNADGYKPNQSPLKNNRNLMAKKSQQKIPNDEQLWKVQKIFADEKGNQQEYRQEQQEATVLLKNQGQTRLASNIGVNQNKKLLTNTSLEHQLNQMSKNQYDNLDPAGQNSRLSAYNRVESGGRRSTTAQANSLNNSQQLKGKLFYQTQVLRKEELVESKHEAPYILNKNMNEHVRTMEQEQAQDDHENQGRSKCLQKVSNQRTSSLENIEQKKLQRKQITYGTGMRNEAQQYQNKKRKGTEGSQEAKSLNSQMKTGTRQQKVQKGAFIDIYGNTQEQLDTDSRGETQTTQQELSNLQNPLHQSSEELSNSMSILTGGVTLTHTQKQSKTKSIMSNYGPVVVPNNNFNDQANPRVYSMMETQSLQEHPTAMATGAKEAKGGHTNQPSIGRASQGKQFFIQKKNQTQTGHNQIPMTMVAKGAQSQQSHYQNMGSIQNMRMQAQSQLAQLSNYNDQRQSWQKKSVNNGNNGQDLDQGSHGQGKVLRTQTSYQTSASIEREVKHRKKSNTSNQSLGFSKNKQTIDKVILRDKKRDAFRENELMNESTPLNVQSLKTGAIARAGPHQKVQNSQSIQNISGLQHQDTKVGLIENLKDHGNKANNTLVNTLTYTMGTIGNSFNAADSYQNTQEKGPKSTQNKYSYNMYNKSIQRLNNQANLRIDKNQIIQSQIQGKGKSLPTTQQSNGNTNIQTINSETNIIKHGSNGKHEAELNSKRLHQNPMKQEANSRAKSMLYTKVLPLPKRICNFDEKAPNANHIQEKTNVLTSFELKNKKDLISNSLENLKGFVVGSTTQKLGNEIKQINKKNVKQAMSFSQTKKKQGQRPLSQTGRLNKHMQPENNGQEEEILQNINFNIDYEAENLLDPYGGDGVQVQHVDMDEQDNELDLLQQLELLNELDQSQLDPRQMTQLNELLKIKKNLQKSIQNTSNNYKSTGKQSLASTMTKINEKIRHSKQSKTALNSFGSTIVGVMQMTAGPSANNKKQRQMVTDAKAPAPNGRQVILEGDGNSHHNYTNQTSQTEVMMHQDLLKVPFNADNQRSNEQLRAADHEATLNQQFCLNIDDYGNSKDEKLNIQMSKQYTKQAKMQKNQRHLKQTSSSSSQYRQTQLLQDKQGSGSIGRSSAAAAKLAQTEQFKNLKNIENANQQMNYSNSYLIQNQIDLKQAELEQQVHDLMVGAQYENFEGQRKLGMERPKSSIAEMMANQQLNKTQPSDPKMLVRGSTVIGMAVNSVDGQGDGHNYQEGTGTYSQQHDEYQDFTDQAIAHTDDRMNSQNNDSNNFEYFRLTGMLNSSQLDHLNLSQLLKHNQLENHDASESMNNLEKSMQMQAKKGKMKSKLAGNIQNHRQTGNMVEAGNTQNLSNGQHNNKNVKEKRFSEQINNSNGKPQQQKQMATYQVVNVQQPRNEATSSGYGNVASNKFTFKDQHLQQVNMTSANQKQKFKQPNQDMRKTSNTRPDRAGTISTAAPSSMSKPQIQGGNSYNQTLAMQNVQQITQNQNKGAQLNQQRLSINSSNVGQNKGNGDQNEANTIPGGQQANNQHWPISQNITTTNMNQQKKYKISKSTKNNRDGTKSAQKGMARRATSNQRNEIEKVQIAAGETNEMDVEKLSRNPQISQNYNNTNAKNYTKLVKNTDNKVMMSSLLNFYASKQQRGDNRQGNSSLSQGPGAHQKRLMTQKLQFKDSFNNRNVTQQQPNPLTNEVYLKGIRNSSASAASHTSQQRQAKNQRTNSQNQQRGANGQMRINLLNVNGVVQNVHEEGNRYKQQNQKAKFNRMQANKDQVRSSSENRYGANQKPQGGNQNRGISMTCYPQSLENTSGNLASNLKKINSNNNKSNQLGSTVGAGGLGGIGQIQAMLNMNDMSNNWNQHPNNNSGNRSSFLGTLKGGLGIMQNLSNAENMENNLNDSMNNIELNQGGKILNIENVLNQLHKQQNQQQLLDQNEQLKQYLNSSQNQILIDNMDEINHNAASDDGHSDHQAHPHFVEGEDVEGLQTPEDPSDQHQFLLFASEGQGHDEPQITQEASINQLDSEEDEIINIQQTQDQFYHVQKLRMLENDAGQQAERAALDAGQEKREQLQNNKTQPLPKQIIRAAKDQSERIVAERTFVPRSQLKTANKKQRSTKIQKQTLENINKGHGYAQNHHEQQQPGADVDIDDMHLERGDPSAAPGGQFVRNTSRGHLTAQQHRGPRQSSKQSRHSQKSKLSQSSMKSQQKNQTQNEDSKTYQTQPATKVKPPPLKNLMLKNNATQLDLKDGDRAGSRVPGGDSLIPNSQTGSCGGQAPEHAGNGYGVINPNSDNKTKEVGEIGSEAPKIGNKKRVEYINKLKDDLDSKIKQRYTNLQQKNTTMSQSNNNLILIDHNSAHNPSNMGDNDESMQTENRVHNYIFGRQIGEGAYAVVRVATSREDNKKYAIKVYDKTKLSDINRQRSVRREVVLLQKMNHDNIVKLIEAFETDSHVYLVMENVSGGSLHSYLKEMINKQLEEEEARRIFKQIMIALKYCHSKCIAHRDIKLENILLDEDKNVKLIDFGFSTCIPNHKKIRMFCGTPSYMAPQIVSKVEYAGPPADIWATGVLLYALLNGCFPFRGQTDDDLYRRIKRGTYNIHNQKVTREYLDILQRCLDVNDDTRATAQDLLDDPWFKIEDIKQKAYDEEKRQFKARILAKVPIIKKSNHTICILAQNQNDGKKGMEEEKEPDSKSKKREGLQIINSNDKQMLQVGNFPYSNNQGQMKGELIISDYGLHSGMVCDRERDRERQTGTGPRNQQQNDGGSSGQTGVSGGAIVLSYGAAVAPQIQINNINNLNLINSNMKKKLNHEAFQAYYNTSSSNHCGMNMMNIQSSPVAGGAQSSGVGNGPPSGGAKAQNSAAALNLNTANVYGQNLLYANNQASGSSSSSSCLVMHKHKATNSGSGPRVLGDQLSSSPLPGGHAAPTSTRSSAENLNAMLYPAASGPNGPAGGFGGPIGSQRGGSGGQGSAASVQSSPYTSCSYHHQIVNNQMAQLHQLQQDLLREKEQKEQLQQEQLEIAGKQHTDVAEPTNETNGQLSGESGGNGEESGEQGGSNLVESERIMEDQE